MSNFGKCRFIAGLTALLAALSVSLMPPLMTSAREAENLQQEQVLAGVDSSAGETGEADSGERAQTSTEKETAAEQERATGAEAVGAQDGGESSSAAAGQTASGEEMEEDLAAAGEAALRESGRDVDAASETLQEEDLVEYIPEVVEEPFKERALADSEVLFEDYLERELYGTADSSPSESSVTASRRLSGVNAPVYTALKRLLQDAADGKRESTIFEIPIYGYLEKTVYSAEDLGLETITDDNGVITAQAKQAIADAVGWKASAVTAALLADCPYELYWFDKTVGYQSSPFPFSYSAQRQTITIKSDAAVTFYLHVTESYAKDYVDFSAIDAADTALRARTNVTLDTEKTGAAAKIAGGAREIVREAESSCDSDWEKLVYYRETICDLVSYDLSSVYESSNYGGAWQLIYVFDGDSSTNVVCEGYAKAFQYLCELTDWETGLTCSMVTGTLQYSGISVKHMWNIIHLSDGSNYLVDLTNCDSGAFGYPDKLFMVGTAADDNGGYVFLDGTMRYRYDSATLSTYEDSDLTLTEGKAHDPHWLSAAEASFLWYSDSEEEEACVVTVTCPLCGETLQLQATVTMEEDAGSGSVIYTAEVTASGRTFAEQKVVTRIFSDEEALSGSTSAVSESAQTKQADKTKTQASSAGKADTTKSTTKSSSGSRSSGSSAATAAEEGADSDSSAATTAAERTDSDSSAVAAAAESAGSDSSTLTAAEESGEESSDGANLTEDADGSYVTESTDPAREVPAAPSVFNYISSSPEKGRAAEPMNSAGGLRSRILSLLIGYLLGMFLTAEVVTRKLTGKPCSELGETGNPGMANVMANLGMKPGWMVLAGDIGKTVLATLLSWILFGSSIGRLAILYAGLGATLGHNYPVWNRFRGGKGVATTCVAIAAFSFGWGIGADLVGALVVLFSQYLCVGAIVIPAVFLLPAFRLYGTEAGAVTLVLTALMAIKHMPAVRGIRSGETKRNDLPGKIRAHMEAGKSSSPEEREEEEEEETVIDAMFLQELRRQRGVRGVEKMDMEKEIIREHILFYGRVQGVGFRYQAMYGARELGLTGWVENLEDGSVEMEVQGTAAGIGRLLTKLQSGNWIRILRMDAEEVPVRPEESGFRVTGYR